MSVLEFEERDGQAAFDEAQCVAAGERLAASYRSAAPFPHIAIDDFLPRSILEGVLREFPDSAGQTYYDREQERLKYQYHPQDCAAPVRHLLGELNSQAFLSFLTAMTGIEGLVPDPYFTGGGLHETKRGGHLGVHADFNIHKRMKLVRRLNLLVYLNDGWEDEFGGKLELWDREMSECRVRIAPVLGRAVVFNTDLDSYHGHPDPLTCPPDRSRRSIATYYYTSPVDGLDALPKRTTVFRQRPGTQDHRDWRIAAQHLWRDWVPPFIQRKLGAKGDGG